MKKFNVFKNGALVGETDNNNRASCQRWINSNADIGTHMREWIKHADGYEYATTVGLYFRFQNKKGST